ncbi:hypothetical protein M8J76_013043 [Diaphorina citri]|nr:hypothetical protein M8J76_013043 [Diaphorina citri]
MNNAAVTVLSLLVALLVSYCLAEDLSHPSHADHMSYPQGGWGKRDLRTIPDAVMDEEANSMDYIPEDVLSEEEKRARMSSEQEHPKSNISLFPDFVFTLFHILYCLSSSKECLSGGFFQPDDNLLRLE